MHEDSLSYANLANLKMLEELYAKWMEDPSSVDESWKNFFEGMQFASQLPQALPQRQDSADLRVYSLIDAYRTYGHLMAKCNPIEVEEPSLPGELKIENFGLSDNDLSTNFPTGGFLKEDTASLQTIIDALQKTYCRSVGIEYMDLGSKEIEKWVQQKIEPFFDPGLSGEEKIAILNQLNQAEGFETFIHTKYVGQKRFSLEGAETFIPILHAILTKGAEHEVGDAFIGMAHRGRLNVLANIMGKSYEYIFEEFEDYYTPDLAESSGDVKYHMGFAGTYTAKEKKIQVVLSANPSHLESVNAVLEGGARAVQEQKKKKESVIPIVVHGDAATAGQGVVYETMTLSRLNGYATGGTIHIVINNQIGFTTIPKDGRSTRYCTDIAKAFGAPVLHVNAEDPEECVAAANLAFEMRQKFGCDVFIDLMGYRKYGHNESDEPTFTQPLQYQLIRSKKSIRQLYRDHLIETKVLDTAKAEEMENAFKAELTKILDTVKSSGKGPQELTQRGKGRHLKELLQPVDTKVDKETLLKVGKKLSETPRDINIHPKLQRLINERGKMLEEGGLIDWGMAECLAYGTLSVQGVHVRLSGQDVRRGTFSHRHSLYVDQVNSSHYFPLSHIQEGQAPCDIFNSPLSEYAVMGFEYGYSLMYPNSLVLWEGQFGDFANGAQVIIDQYLTTSEMKWGHATNMTLLLPHGYEGMGPEHSSGRMERFLQASADDNIIVANCTKPSQLFHILRRQALRSLKKPLILFTPKALLRHPQCKSEVGDFTNGQFEEILIDEKDGAKRLIFCSGKVYYELTAEKERLNDTIIRIEQIYPLHEEKIKKCLEKYSSIESCLYVQEEHENMGAWRFLRPKLEKLLGNIPLTYVGREESASPAAGSHALHQLELNAILEKVRA